MERDIVLLCCILRAWEALYYYCVIFSACGTRSGVIVLYFPRVERTLELLCYIFLHVERALALLCYIFHAWNALWYFVSDTFCVEIYLPCDLSVFISKLSSCKGVEFSAAFLAVFSDL